MTPSAPAAISPQRPAQADYLDHIEDGHGWAQCCRDSARAGDVEDGRWLGWPGDPLTSRGRSEARGAANTATATAGEVQPQALTPAPPAPLHFRAPESVR